MLSQGSTLIIDDKIEDGQPISEQLKNLYIPHLFFHADEKEIINFTESKSQKIKKVRIIFQDINLTGGTSPSTQDYDKAATIIETLLESSNGPWLLVTWSTWSSEDENAYGKNLFEHLRRELEPGLRPYDFVSLDKTYFTSTKHGDVKTYSTLSGLEKSHFKEIIEKSTVETKAITALIAWEKSVDSAVSCTLAELHSLSGTGENSNNDRKLGKILYELAKAESGKSLTNDNFISSLSNILNSQLFDRASVSTFQVIDINDYERVDINSEIKNWRKDINRLLHFSVLSQSNGPGSVYLYSSFLKATSLCYSNYDGIADDVAIIDDGSLRHDFIELINKTSLKAKFERHKEILINCVSQATYVAVEITAPCDHAQNKAFYLKFCGGIIIDLDNLSTPELDIFEKIFSSVDYLWSSCGFSNEKSSSKHSKFILNSRMLLSCSDDKKVIDKLELAPITKMREQITRDLTHWIGQQLTRPGYTYM
jgi:hypothetical protein